MLLWALALSLIAGGACGKKGRPLPPQPHGPLAPSEVRGRQLGRLVQVGFLAPPPRGVQPAQQPVLAELVRVAYEPGRDAPPDPDAFRRRGIVVDRKEGDPLPVGARIGLEDHGLDQLPDRGVGWTLRFAVRIRDRRGRPSPLVVARDLVPLAVVPAPSGLAAQPTADGIRVVWRAPDVPVQTALRYKIYRARAGEAWPEVPLNSDPLEATEYLDAGVEPGVRYAYQVRVALAVGLPYREGEPSAAAEVLAEDRLAPAAPEGLVAVQEGHAVRLFWNPNRERDLAGYRLQRSVDGGPWTSIGPNPLEQPLFLDTDVQPGQHLIYRVAAVDRAQPQNESAASEPVELVLVEEPAAQGSPR